MAFRLRSVFQDLRILSVCLFASRLALAQAPPSVEPPRVIHEAPAEYPPAELAEKHEATVVLLVTIGRDGNVTEVAVAESAGQAFDEAAVSAVRRWHFSPAQRAGESVASRIRVPFRFELPAVAHEQEAPRAPGSPAERTPVGVVVPSGTPPAGAPVEIVVQSERELRSEQRSSGDFRVERDVLRAAPRREGSDTLRVVPGLSMGRGESPAVAHSYMLRGFDAEHGQDIEFRVGGLPINQPSHLHGQGYADLGFLIAETVRDVHVRQGVYDPVQSDFAVAGTIDIELGVDEDERGVVLRSGYGSFDTFRQLVMWAPREGERETFGAVLYGRTDGFGENRAAQAASGIFQYRFGSGRLRYRALGILHASQAELAGVLRKDDIDAGRVCFHCVYPYRAAHAQNAASSRALFGFFAEHRAENGANGELGFWLDQSDFLLQENFTGFTETVGEADAASGLGDLSEQRNHARAVGLMSRYRTAPYRPASWAQGTLEVGAQGRFDLIDQSQNPVGEVASNERVDAEIRGFDLGFYGDLDWRFGHRVRMRLGFRADALSYDIDDRVGTFAAASNPEASEVGARRTAFGLVAGPRTSVEVTALSWLSLLAAYGEGYRSPQARVLDDGDAPFTKVRGADVGARFHFGAPLELSLGGFYTRLSDDVAFDADEGRLERIGETERFGGTAYLVSHPADWLVEALSFTFVDATELEPPPATPGEAPLVAEGEPLPFVPPVVIRADIGARRTLVERVGLGRLEGRAGIGLSFLSPRPLPSGGHALPVALFDASAGLVWGPLDLTLDAYNLLDTDNAAQELEFSSSWDPAAAPDETPARHIAAGPPLSFMLSLGVTL